MTHFNKESFDKALDQGKLMMVDFWADWCGPCRMLGPVIEDLADRYEGKAVVGKVNVDDEQELAIRYGVMSIPTVIFFKDGKEIVREGGRHARERLHRGAGQGAVRALVEGFQGRGKPSPLPLFSARTGRWQGHCVLFFFCHDKETSNIHFSAFFFAILNPASIGF